MHRFLLHNGGIRDASEKMLSPGQVGLLNGWGVFSTIRVAEGVLFAWERHWARMRRDAALLRVPFPEDPAGIQADLLRLVDANHASNATLRISIVRNRGGLFEAPNLERDFDVIAFTKDLSDWGDGVHLGVQTHARHAACAFAGAKILSWSANLAWLESARARGFDEVVLLNEHGKVSECTSANIFAVLGGQVVTPPLTAGCLPGITRELLLGDARPPEISVIERDLELEDLSRAGSVFITSTTRGVLPVLSIEKRSMQQQAEPGRRLQQAFSEYFDSYVSARRGALAR